MMVHRVQAHRDIVADAMVRIHRAPPVIVGADRSLHDRQVFGARFLGDEVDRAADAARSVEHRIGAIIDFDLLQIERIGAAVLRAVADAVDRDVGVGRIAAQVDAVAIAATALARAEGDAGDRLQRIAQRLQVLLAQHLVGDDGDRLRRVDQRRRRLRAFDHGRRHLPLAVDDDVVALALAPGILRLRVGGDVGLRGRRNRISGKGWRGREEADARQRQKRWFGHQKRSPLWGVR